MKILMIHQGYEMYGSDKMFVQSADALRYDNPDNDIDIWIPKRGVLYDLFLKKGFNTEIKSLSILRKNIFIPFNLFNWIGFSNKLIVNIINFIKLFKTYDIIYINTITIIDAIIAARFVKRKKFIHVHEMPKGIMLKIFTCFLRLSRSKLIFISKAVSDTFSQASNNSALLLNGVPCINEYIVDFNKCNMRILLIGRINSWKGHKLLLEAISMLSIKILEEIELRIVGDVFEDQFFYKEELEELVKNLELEKNVYFYSFSNTPADFYNWANIVIVPSTSPEPFGLVAIEAMSIAKTVIVANHGGLKEIVTNKLDGLTFKPNNVLDLVSKIEYLYFNKDEIIKLGGEAKETFNSRFSEERYMFEFSNIILR
tara:strand:+ start:2390 stop:3499 length:1110 start_codon:yes stop_codon:yes gene_type:complete